MRRVAHVLRKFPPTRSPRAHHILNSFMENDSPGQHYGHPLPPYFDEPKIGGEREMGKGRRETGNGTGDGRRETGDGRHRHPQRGGDPSEAKKVFDV